MKIHLICPVRNVTEEQQKEIDDYCAQLEQNGHIVHNPKYAVDQDDPTGFFICEGHYESMKDADRVDIFWDVNSKGSHFDLGMAFALRKNIKVVKLYTPDNEGKSYAKVMYKMEKISQLEDKIELARKEKNVDVKTGEYEHATKLREIEIELRQRLTNLIENEQF